MPAKLMVTAAGWCCSSTLAAGGAVLAGPCWRPSMTLVTKASVEPHRLLRTHTVHTSRQDFKVVV